MQIFADAIVVRDATRNSKFSAGLKFIMARLEGLELIFQCVYRAA